MWPLETVHKVNVNRWKVDGKPTSRDPKISPFELKIIDPSKHKDA